VRRKDFLGSREKAILAGTKNLKLLDAKTTLKIFLGVIHSSIPPDTY
jgi:hypothetical protein